MNNRYEETANLYTPHLRLVFEVGFTTISHWLFKLDKDML